VAFRTPLLVLCLSFALGCASHLRLTPETPVRGPGTTFATAEAAVLDGLGWCALESRQDGDVPRLRIGVVRAARGGFTYDKPGIATRLQPRELWYKLQRESVAHFQHYPVSLSERKAYTYEQHSRYQREVVDEIDPRHRPSYILTPSMRVVAYRGDGEELLVARLPRPVWSGGEALAAR